ncbi:MAG: hypothetical protein H6858_01715 [Rhodospirillales bacterium]|nr:hypothetical protein [Alphaproteobacteria bacterium]MCB1839651.1 hypothetical protein [Alphaproteobacteria bacterium]MCB9976300.1 hypothetical protein [Rhodospirillales bacterium]
MRPFLFMLCLLSLTGCGIVHRVLPRPKPRVIVVENTLGREDPCRPDAVVLALASVSRRESAPHLPT